MSGDPTWPTTTQDLPRPFERVGEPGWAQRTIEVLESFDVPLPLSVADQDISSAEARVGLRFPQEYRQMLLELGCLRMDGYRFLLPAEICRADHVLGPHKAPPELDDALRHWIAVAEYCGNDTYFVLDCETSQCALLRLTPPRLTNMLPGVGALVRVALLMLPSSYYGWPSGAIAELCANAQLAEYGTRL